MEPIAITLAGERCEVPPFTTNQVRKLHGIALRRMPPDLEGEALTEFIWQQNVDILVCSLSKSRPDMTAEKIGDLPIGEVTGLADAAGECLIFAGLAKRKDEPGEPVPPGERERAPT